MRQGFRENYSVEPNPCLGSINYVLVSRNLFSKLDLTWFFLKWHKYFRIKLLDE